MATTIRASHPISFELLNRDRHAVIGIFDGHQGQMSTLEIKNTSRRDLMPKTLTGPPTAANHHFELRFRPGTLNQNGTPIAVEAGLGGWKISAPTETDGAVSLYLLSTTPKLIKSGDTASLMLQHLGADGSAGARGTRVELKWAAGKFEYTGGGEAAEPLVAGHRVQHLSIVNERGQKHIPLHVGIVGGNKVLNDGSANVLKMRITNLLKHGQGNIQLNPKDGPDGQPGSEFRFSFDASDTEDWALAKDSDVGNIVIDAVARGKAFNKRKDKLGQSTVFTLWPSERVVLEPDQFIDVTISNIKSSLPSGQANVYVHYQNIPGYWDGDFVCDIEKAPVVYKEQLVGIGTNDPKAKLHVKGKVRVDNELSVGGQATLDKLRVEKELSVGAQATLDKLRVEKELSAGGSATFDKLRVEKDVSVGASGVFEVDATSSSGAAKGGRFRIESDGRVGIGTATNSPEKHLHVAGAGDQEIMIQSTESGGVKWTLQSAANEGRFEIINRSAGANCFTIAKGGNVGIGTVTPGAYINEGNYFKADKDGRILEVHSPQHEAVLILSSNQDRDDAHLGGLYFTRTKGTKDAHREVAAIKCRQLFDDPLAGGYLQFFTKPSGGGANFDNPRMVIRENGLVGIGVNNPQKAMLQVGGSVSTEVPNGYRYMNYKETLNAHHKTTQPYSIWAEKRIAAEEFNSMSDARIKNIRGRSDGAADLSTLLAIEITDYSFRDVISKGAGTYKKVIGQQVEKVFPQAVSRQTEVVPDIYQQAPIHDGWVRLATDLKTGERVKLITEKGEDVHEVLEVTDDNFRIEGAFEGEKVFVFGREVDDLCTVDYDAISMLNVSATQQLKKEMDQEVKALRVENAELRAANDELAKRLQLLESKLETILGVVSAHNGSNGNGRR